VLLRFDPSDNDLSVALLDWECSARADVLNARLATIAQEVAEFRRGRHCTLLRSAVPAGVRLLEALETVEWRSRALVDGDARIERRIRRLERLLAEEDDDDGDAVSEAMGLMRSLKAEVAVLPEGQRKRYAAMIANAMTAHLGEDVD
jgi:hypothetical protein